MTRIFSIGHSNQNAADFIALLKRHGVRHVMDVRSLPASRRYPHFNCDRLEKTLAEAAITYEWEPRLGGRKRADAQNFEDGLDHLLTRAKQSSTAMMCAEADPEHCHRGKLITPALLLRGQEVRHILKSGTARDAAPDLFTWSGD